jgi:sugar phosphate isomerase/epimerase
MPFKLGVARYTLHKKNFDQALEMLQDMDCHYMGLKEGSIKYDASDAEIAAYKAKCAKYGVEVVSAGPLYFRTEEELKACMEFAKRYGMKYISVVPYEWNPKIANVTDNKERAKIIPGREWRLESDKMMDLLEKYVKKYDIKAAVHNHGPDNAYLYPTAEASLKRIAGRDKRIGVCLDVGHNMRAGADPIDFIRKHGDRIYEVHIKNIKVDPVKNIAKEGPRGELNIPGIFKALADIGFDGYCLIEFEKDFDVNEVPLAESIGYYRGVMDSVKFKPVMKPVPAGANTLTAAEKAEGFELLFDGKNLPADKWVGDKEKFKCFPTKGWYVKDGCLTMRPMSCIVDGKWSALPPEDQKLGGGGNIVTKKMYRDFIFKFDFRLTEAANSGVKYFYVEGKNKTSCEEYQILDPEHPDANKGRDGNRRVASLYDLMPANADKIVKRAGEWNSGMIVSKGNHVEHWLNGVKVLEYTRGNEAFRRAVDVSKYKTWGTDGRRWGELPEGRLLLQDHSDSFVSYCNLKIKEL